MSSSSWLPISSTTGVFWPMPGVAFLALLYIRVVSCNSTSAASDLATVATYLDRLSGSVWQPRDPTSDQPFKVGDTVKVKGAPARAPTMTVTKIATLEGYLTA